MNQADNKRMAITTLPRYRATWQLLLLFCTISYSSCKEKEVAFSANNCKSNPPFIQGMGFEPKASFFSTSEQTSMGLVLLQSSAPGSAQASIVKREQHPSWRKGGWLAPIVLDKVGNIFTAPAPFISVLDNPVSNQNTIYKVDGNTGVMDEFLRLPLSDTTVQNPFGIIGMILLCESNTLYVSSLSGSDQLHERGAIYAVDLDNKKIIDKITATDAMGMGISYITGKRTLYFGTGRSSDIYAVELTSNGKFEGKPQQIFSIAGLGVSGDDKVRRISTDNYGNLTIHGVSFAYNLIPAREKKETIYTYIYDGENKKWVLNGVNGG